MPPGTANNRGFSAAQASLRTQYCLLMLSAVVCLGCQESAGPGIGRTSPRKTTSPAVVSDQSGQTQTSHAAGNSFTGSAACADCHSETYAEYQSHPMSHSLASAQKAVPIEDMSSPRFSPIPELAYLVEQDDDHIWHHELRLDGADKVVYDQRVKMDYVVGSGARGRSYLNNSAGRLYQSPITWYTGGNNWGLSPGYPEKSHPRFDRQVSHACLACHAGRMNPHATDPDRFADPIFQEEAVGCERCHGAGSSHIAFHKMDESLRDGADPIVNPERFRDSRRDAVCNQCHLQGQRRVTVNGRSEFDFRPGMHLSDVWTVFLKTAGIKEGVADAVSQVEQMHASACFQKSNGELSCVSCHDPHRSPSLSETSDHYRDRCLQCHSDRHPQCTEDKSVRMQVDSDSCIKCHMPRFAAADVHSAQSDHRIPRHPPATTVATHRLGSEASKDALVFFEEPGVVLSQATKDRAAGIYLAERGYLGNDSIPAQRAVELLTRLRIRTQLQQNSPADAEVSFSLGKALIQTKRFRDGMEILEALLEVQPTREDLLDTLATTYHEHGRLEQAKDHYERLIKLNPERAKYYGRYSHVVGQLGDYKTAIETAEKALVLDPSLVQAHAWLAEICEKVGDQQRAAYHKAMVQSFEVRPVAPNGSSSETKKVNVP